MKFNIITIFPNIINSYCAETILARAQKNNLLKINAVNLRDFTDDNRKTVDDTPYGGGAGMVMKVEPIYKALKSLGAVSKKNNSLKKVIDVLGKISNLRFNISDKKKTILLSPRGKQFDQRMAENLSKYDEITFVCGRYEGIDQRVTDYLVDEEVSIGPYVLAGGELGALVILEAVSRLVPGVLGNQESLSEETFGNGTLNTEHGKLNKEYVPCSILHESCVEYAQYTKPADFNGWKVPEVLLSGDHKKIKEWRNKKSE